MAHKFTQLQREVYELRKASPPESRGSGGLAAAYYRGIDAPRAKPPYHPTSLAYACWCAGVEASDGLSPELRRSVRICHLTDPIRAMLEQKEASYRAAGMTFTHKDAAEAIVCLLIDRTEEVL